MRSWSPSVWMGVLVALACTACLGQPIPRRVVAGTTLTFPFSTANISNVPVAYGSLDSGTLLSSDRQRGNVRFVLCQGTNCSTERSTILRYMGRITPDRGSRLGRAGDLETVAVKPFVSGRITGQPIVVLDIPFATPAGTYQLTYVLRPPNATTDMRVTLQPIEIVAGNGANLFTNLETALNLSGEDLTPSLQGFVPDPQLVLPLVDTINLEDKPAAGSLVLRFPSTVQVLGVFEDGVLGQGSLVRMNPGPMANTVSILFLDPDRKLPGLRVAFELTAAATAPVTSTAFSIDSQTLYRTDGSVLPSTTDQNAVGNSFRIDSFMF